jgi:two-component system sporulation sensor kinase B
MLAEKLLLHILIVLAPIFLYHVFLENSPLGKSRIATGLLQGTAALLCMCFPFVSRGFYWDLRYVPLVMSFLYGGPIAGAIVYVVIVAMRVAIGGAQLLYGLGTITAVALLPLLLSARFYSFQRKNRIVIGFLMALWSTFTALCAVAVYVFIFNAEKFDTKPLHDIIWLGMIQLVAMLVSALMHEIIIDRKVMKKEMERAEKMNTLGELAASIAHEVRNPLTVVKGFLQLMQQERSVQYVPLILTEVERAEKIISDYLNFAKPKFNKVEQFHVNVVIAEVIQLLEPLAVNKGIKLKNEVHENLLLETDCSQLKQALLNIIKNAIEATDKEGQVIITSSLEQGEAKIIIADNGKGMTKEQLSRIGTLFYTTKDKGTGLGTMVSLRIIEAMNGKLSYTSEPGIGTEATISLPLKGNKRK